MATITQTMNQPRINSSNGVSVRTIDYNDSVRVRYLFVEGMRCLISPIMWTILFHPVFFGLLLTASVGIAASFSIRVLLVFLLVVIAALYLYGYYLFYEYTRDSLRDDLADIEKYYLKCGRSNFWAAEIDGEIVGIVGLEEKSKDEAELRRMSVDSSVRGRGIAQKLLNNLIDFCRYHGYKEITLGTTSLQVPAIRLYRKNGFQFINSISVAQPIQMEFYRLKL